MRQRKKEANEIRKSSYHEIQYICCFSIPHLTLLLIYYLLRTFSYALTEVNEGIPIIYVGPDSRSERLECTRSEIGALKKYRNIIDVPVNVMDKDDV